MNRETIKATLTPATFARYVSNGQWKMAPHHAFMDRLLCKLARRDITRLVIEMPPRHGKSLLGSQYFPAWWLGTFPQDNVILTSATTDLALDFSTKARDTLHEFGQSTFGVRIRPDRAAARRWQLTSGGMLRAAGVGTSIVGHGANLFVVDDYVKDVQSALSPTYRDHVHRWFHGVAASRLTPDGVIVVIATRWNPDDLIGRLLDEAEKGGEKYERIRFPAIAETVDEIGRDTGEALWPSQFSLQWLLKRRAAYMASGYPWQWEALYQQNPPELLDAEWESSYFNDDVLFDDWPESNTQWKLVTLDPSLGRTDKSDYSAFIMMLLDNDGTMWIDADITRRDVSRMVDDAIGICRAFRAQAFCCEEVGFQSALEPLFVDRSSRQGFMLPYHGIGNPTNKLMRIRSTLTPFLRHGKFKFKRGSSGVALLLEQLKGFPSHRYDDGPDALEMAVRFAQQVHQYGPEMRVGGVDRVYA